MLSFADIETDPNRAPPCDPSVCVLPDCFCSEDGTTTPGDIPPKDVPQMITITFDDAINNNNIDLYKEMFNGKRKNPNGCNIKATVNFYDALQGQHFIEKLFFNCSILSRINTQTIQLCKKHIDEDTKSPFIQLRK